MNNKPCTQCKRTEMEGAKFSLRPAFHGGAARWDSWCWDCNRLSSRKSGSRLKWVRRWVAEHPELFRIRQLKSRQAATVRNRVSRKRAIKWRVPITPYEIAVAMSPHLSVALAALWLGRTNK